MFFSVALLGRAAKRLGYLRLTTKRAKKGYYKGKGAIAPGRHTKRGYKLDPLRRPNFITPEIDLASFPLKPYVAKTVPKKPLLVPGGPRERRTAPSPADGCEWRGLDLVGFGGLAGFGGVWSERVEGLVARRHGHGVGGR